MKTKLLSAAAIAVALPTFAMASPLAGKNYQHMAPALLANTQAQLDNGDYETGPDRFTGVGEIVTFVKPEFGGGAFVCTASLLNATTLITAAHCLDSGPDRQRTGQAYSQIQFRTGANWRSPDAVYLAEAIKLHPDYIDFSSPDGPENDIALIKLAAPVSNGEEFYDIYRNFDEHGQVHTKVGGGTTGYGDAGTTPTIIDDVARGGLDGFKRDGQNIWENINNGLGYSESFLLADFDNGTDTNNLFGKLDAALEFFGIDNGEFGDTGVRDEFGNVIDYGVGGGDSGGPSFINGQIAGITSFGSTFAPFFGGCGPGAGRDYDGSGVIEDDEISPDADSRAPGENTFTSNGFDCLNSSYGELNGDTRVSFFQDFVDAGLAGDFAFSFLVPAPGVLALFGLGLGGLAIGRRRKK